MFFAIRNYAQTKADEMYPKALVNYSDYKSLVTEVEAHRIKRLISLNKFIDFSKEANTIILDTRPKLRYDQKHIKGAIHLQFSEFTQDNLRRLIPNPNTRILIYCNNNFEGDQISFASKVMIPPSSLGSNTKEKSTTLALNIPTFINLYGYGYKNIFELGELVNIFDNRIRFEGSLVP